MKKFESFMQEHMRITQGLGRFNSKNSDLSLNQQQRESIDNLKKVPSNTNLYKEVGTIGGYLPEIATNTIQILEKP